MAEQDTDLLAFNRGVISPRGLARIDLERMAMSADEQTNMMARVLGSMMLRPGFEFIDRTLGDATKKARQIPFVFGVDDTAQLEFSDVGLRVRIDDVLITRPSVATTVGNDSFNVVLTPWTDQSDAGGTVSAISLGYVDLTGDGTDFGRIEQQVTVAGADQNVEHALFVDIEYGKVLFKVGSTSGDDDYVQETRLGRGCHSLAFTPTGNFFIQIGHERTFIARVNECSVEAAGAMNLQTEWAVEDLPFLRFDQSGDVIYVACKNASTTGLPRNAEVPRKIERRGTGRSWSVVTYEPEDGPFRVQNVSGITMTPSALTGNITITASKPFFKENLHANNNFGALIRIASEGQNVTRDISAQNLFTDPIRVTGTEEGRRFGYTVTGTWSATVTVQFSIGVDTGPWNDIPSLRFTGNISSSYLDGQDGQIIYYRIGVKTGEYTSGTVTVGLNYTSGSIQGIARINTIASSTVANAAVLQSFGDTNASKDWWEGEWSYYRGHPTAVGLHENRLWWAGNDKIIGSISDAFESFDDNQEGDSGPVNRNVGRGPIKIIHWLLSMGRLLMGTSETSANVAAADINGNNVLGARSNSFDEPLTPTNFNVKNISSKGVFVDRSQQRLYELTYNLDEQDYQSLDLSVFAPDYNAAGIVQIAVQIKPDVRVHCVRSDGTVGVLVFDRLENVICWLQIDSTAAGGEIEDVSVLPGVVEDQVYYIIKRTINGASQRHLCKWAMESEAIGGQLNKMADSFVSYEGAATTTPFTTELLHLRGETVVIWADGLDVGTDVVTDAGALTNPLATAASNVVAGLHYRGRFKSAKLGRLDGIGLLETKKVNRLGFIAENLHHLGLQYGPDFDNLADLPQVDEGQVVATGTVYSSYHEDDFPFGGSWQSDSRICLEANAPRPCTILAAIAQTESVERTTVGRARR